MVCTYVLSFFLIISCNDTTSDSKNSVTTDSSSNVTSDSSSKVVAKPIELKMSNKAFGIRYSDPSFKKFRFKKFTHSGTEDVRFFCYALSADEDEVVNRIGDNFVLSRTNFGDDVEDTPPESSMLDELALDKDNLLKIFENRPLTFKYIELKPTTIQFKSDKNGNSRNYGTYQIFIDGDYTGFELNPSPPGFN